MGAFFLGLIVVMFNGAADLNFTIMRLPVFYEQRDSHLYPAWAFALPTWIVKIPVSFLEAGIWILITYYGIGLAPEASRYFRRCELRRIFAIVGHVRVSSGSSLPMCCRFFKQFLLLFCLHQMSSGLFRFLASIGRTLIVANTWGNFALLIVSVLGGFVLSRGEQPGLN